MKFSEKKYDTKFIIPERVVLYDNCINAHILLSEKPRQVIPYDRESMVMDFGKFCYTQFRPSLCHGWASGQTAFLSEYVLGVKILEPGCRKVKISAPPCGLKMELRFFIF